MAEKLSARVMDTGEPITVSDPEPLASSRVFKALSDKLWEQRRNERMAVAEIGAAISPLEARNVLNEALVKIDPELVIAAGEQPLSISSGYPEEPPIEFSAELLARPRIAGVGTFNWDERCNWRFVEIQGERKGVEFTNGHVDYYRELYANLAYRTDEGALAILTYSMQRMQPHQDQPTSLASRMWYSDFAETGYEGNHLSYRAITPDQEMYVLGAIQKIGGLAIESV